jgi:hypothetical protein
MLRTRLRAPRRCNNRILPRFFYKKKMSFYLSSFCRSFLLSNTTFSFFNVSLSLSLSPLSLCNTYFYFLIFMFRVRTVTKNKRVGFRKRFLFLLSSIKVFFSFFIFSSRFIVFYLLSNWFFLSFFISPFFFVLILFLFFSHMVSSLVYPNLFGTKKIGCCCCCRLAQRRA